MSSTRGWMAVAAVGCIGLASVPRLPQGHEDWPVVDGKPHELALKIGGTETEPQPVVLAPKWRP